MEAAPGEYCLSVNPYGNWRPTTALPLQFTVNENSDLYFEIGFYDTVITITPETLPDATVGKYYEQAITINGGKLPYEISIDQALPDGMTFNQETFTLSGTPTTAVYDSGSLSLRVVDADGMTGEWHPSLEIRADGSFALTSSDNPSPSGEEVTFTLSGSGEEVIPEIGPIPPVGFVAFYDGDTLIAGCEEVVLNLDPDTGDPADRPAECTTSVLAAGSHEIRAAFTDYPGLYNDATRTLMQEVGQSSNTAPIANPGGPYLGAISTAIALDGSGSTDADGDALSYSWTVGGGALDDGTEVSPTYAAGIAAGIYNVCLTVSDGRLASAPACVMAVVYDPSGGFVTGGGWIDSPAGAYKLDKSLSGKATFGFVSKYQKGAKVPSGTTEFEFDTAGLEFPQPATNGWWSTKLGTMRSSRAPAQSTGRWTTTATRTSSSCGLPMAVRTPSASRSGGKALMPWSMWSTTTASSKPLAAAASWCTRASKGKTRRRR